MFDVAVIGRGLIGSAAARHLAEAGLGVVAIGPDEPDDWAAWDGPFASHFDEGRITRISDRDPSWSAVASRSIARYADIEARSGVTFHHPVGLAISTPDLATWLDTSRAGGAAVRSVDAGWLAETTGIVVPEGAPVAHEEAPAGFINPRRLVAAQNLLARRAGASILAGAVTSLARTSLSAIGPSASGSPTGAGRAGGFTVGGPWGTVEAAGVIVATGAFGHGLLGPERDGGLGLVRRPRTVLLAELGPDRSGDRPLPALIMRDQSDERLASIYWVPPVRYPDGRIYLKIGGVLADDRAIGTGPDPHGELVEWFHGRGDQDEAAALRAALEARLPDRTILRTRTVPCVYTGTPSGHPIIDRLDEGLVVAVGGNGAAAKSSDELGRLAAALIAAGTEADGRLGPGPDPAVNGPSAPTT